jgi:hypothetical protein
MPDGIFVIEEAGVVEADEELRIGRIRVVGTRHAERAALEVAGIEFGGDVGELRAARAGAGRVAGLGHEAGDDAVKDDAVVELLADQRLDLLDVVGREVRTQLDDRLAVLGLEDEGVRRREVVGEGGKRQKRGRRNQRAAGERHHESLICDTRPGRGRGYIAA